MGWFLFILGAAFGSFLNVLAVRYDPDRFLLSPKAVGGRSRCPHCGRTLSALELFPLASFLVLGGRCRGCRKRISLQYPLVEIFAGLIAVLVATRIFSGRVLLFPMAETGTLSVLAALYAAAFLALLLLALIDRKWQLIPDEITVFLGLLGIGLMPLIGESFQWTGGSFVGSYAPLFGWRESGIVLNRLVGSLSGGGFLLLLYAVTRGRGIGLGDVKLSFALGLLFGWPDALLIHLFAFVIGSVYGIFALYRGKHMKTLLAFGPFLALGALVVFMWGEQILDFYFSLFGWNPLELI